MHYCWWCYYVLDNHKVTSIFSQWLSPFLLIKFVLLFSITCQCNVFCWAKTPKAFLLSQSRPFHYQSSINYIICKRLFQLWRVNDILQLWMHSENLNMISFKCVKDCPLQLCTPLHYVHPCIQVVREYMMLMILDDTWLFRVKLLQ